MSKQMNLGELIAALERKNQSLPVYFDFVYFRPKGIHSYRGDYSQLAIGYEAGIDVTVGQLVELCKDANGKTFTGWKGGEYDMWDDTPVWVANPDEAGGTAICDVRDDEWSIRLITKQTR